MARNRLPPAKAAVSGAAIKNAGRFEGRESPTGARPIGNPYAAMNEAEKACWHELAQELPWLNSRHRILLRMTCKLSARLDDGELGVEAMKALSSLLSKLGATPVDESKVNYGADEEDAADEFFGQPH